jgi:hypothetical protein
MSHINNVAYDHLFYFASALDVGNSKHIGSCCTYMLCVLIIATLQSAGTFTLSNLGMFGVDRFDAILPPGTVR